MDDTISRREILRRLDRVIKHGVANQSGEHPVTAEVLKETIINLPSPQIHCKDCKYYQRLSESCRSLRLKTGDEWYCADAERKVTE